MDNHERRTIMARFPVTESEILALAQKMIVGLTANPNFPSPPVSNEALDSLRVAFQRADDAAQAADAAARRAHEDKDVKLAALVTAMRSDVLYAESVARNNDPVLQEIGWGSRAVPVKLQTPGQCLNLNGARQDEGVIVLRWNKPKQGGKVETYLVQRRERMGGSWQFLINAWEPWIVLTGQPRNVELEYRVVGGNKAGEGIPSNTVMAVL
jgi:hypothetical protein